MKHEESYDALISDEGVPVFIFRFKEGEAVKPVILYDGGRHATLYRNTDEVILLDYLHEDLQPVLAKAPFAVVMEMTEDGRDIYQDYRAEIKIVKHNPLIDGLE